MNPISIRARLDDECRSCGKHKDVAESIHPVVYGRYPTGPDWSCGECLND